MNSRGIIDLLEGVKASFTTIYTVLRNLTPPSHSKHHPQTITAKWMHGFSEAVLIMSAEWWV